MRVQNEDIELQSLQRQKPPKTSAQQYLQQRIKAPYFTHNAYTNDKSFLQLLTLALFIVQVTLHSIYIAPYIYRIKNEILNFIFILNYFIMCAVIGHYVYLTTCDPVDSLIIDLNQKETVEKNSKQETVFCIMCQKTVKKTSKHCYDCGRCTEEYDHHCVYLNNCVGLGNYQEFIRLLLFYQIFNALMTLQAIWIIVKADQANYAANICLIILSMLIFIAVVLLLVFHCYLNCIIRKPTYQYLKDRKNRKYEIGDKVEYKNYVGDVLGMVLKENKLNLVKQKSQREQTGFRK